MTQAQNYNKSGQFHEGFMLHARQSFDGDVKMAVKLEFPFGNCKILAGCSKACLDVWEGQHLLCII